MHGFICAKTKKKAIELAYNVDRTSQSNFRDYWSDIGNDAMRETAMDKEGVWIEIKPYSNKYVGLEEFVKKVVK